MKRIIYHWSGGTYRPNCVDIKHYHFLIDEKGKIYHGDFLPEDNANCTDGKYAMHTGGGNTNSIGIAFCGMRGFVDRKRVGNYPLTKKQCEAGFLLGAKLVLRYNLDLSDILSIQTHYGFGLRNKHTSSFNKIDIIYLPPYPDIKKEKIEKFIFSKVLWYYNLLVKKERFSKN